MKKLVNALCSFFKYILLVAAFGVTLFVILRMNARLDKSILDSINVFIPYCILVVLFIVNIALNRKAVTKNVFFNITAVIIFATIIIIGLRSIFDKSMLFNSIQGMDTNFVYFDDNLAFMKIMLYGLSIIDFIFMLVPNSYVESGTVSSNASKSNRKEKLKEIYQNKDTEVSREIPKDEKVEEEIEVKEVEEETSDDLEDREDIVRDIYSKLEKDLDNIKDDDNDKNNEIDDEII